MKGASYLALVALLAASNVLAGEDYLRLKEVEAEWKATADTRTVSVEVKTAAPIPTDGKAGAFGYAFLSDATNNVLVVVTHLPIDDSSYEKVPSGFHTHVLDLKSPSAACDGASFEVDIPASKANTQFDANFRWEAEGSEVEIKNVPVAELGDAGIETVASFKLKPVTGPDGKPTNLCVSVVDQK